MSLNLFFKKKKILINNVFEKLNLKKNFIINDIKSLSESQKNDLTFFDSVKYKADALSTKASLCITTEKLEKFLSF